MKTKDKIKLIKEIGSLLENNTQMYVNSGNNVTFLDNDTIKLLKETLVTTLKTIDVHKIKTPQ